MADRQLTEHFLEKITQVSAVSERIKVRLVLLRRRLQVQAVVVRVIEKVALNAPGLAVHLLPLGPRVNIDLHVFGLDLSFAGLDRLRGGNDEPVVGLTRGLTEEHLFTVGRDVKAANAVQNLFELALLHVELVQSDPRYTWCRRQGFKEEDRIRFGHGQ